MDAPQPRFAVSLLGHEDQRSHTKYNFRVRHCGGCEWTVLRRYQDLHDLHERLLGVFGDRGLPLFPPRTTFALGSLFGPPAGSRPDIVADRERAFQRYFDALCARQEVVRTFTFQSKMGVLAPGPVSQLRVRSWSSSNKDGVTALLEVRPEGQEEGSSAVADSFHILARLVFIDPSTGKDELGLVADLTVPATDFTRGALDTRGNVEGLKPGAQVEFEVSAVNAVGSSTPVAIRLLVPAVEDLVQGSDNSGKASHAETATVMAAEAAAGQAPRTPEASRGPPVAAAAAEAGLSEAAREELDQWWQERRRDMEAADAERERQMAEFQAQREELNRHSGQQFSASPFASPLPSVPASPRESCVEPSFGGSIDAILGSQWEALRAQQEELELQWAELRNTQELQQEEAQRLAVERDVRMAAEASSSTSGAPPSVATAESSGLRDGADLSESLVAQQEELARQRSELEVQRQEQVAERQRSEEAAAALQAALEAQQADLTEKAHELQALEAEKTAALERAKQDAKGTREALQKEREELIQQREEYCAAVAAAAAERSARLSELAEQQALLERQRTELENDRAADAGGPKLEALRAEQAELARQQEELQCEKEVQEEERRLRAVELHEAETEFEQRTRYLAVTERALLQERQELARSKANLAMVQAHVMSMLDRAAPAGEAAAGQMTPVQLDDDDDDALELAAEGGEQTIDHVWSMDWSGELPAEDSSQS